MCKYLMYFKECLSKIEYFYQINVAFTDNILVLKTICLLEHFLSQHCQVYVVTLYVICMYAYPWKCAYKMRIVSCVPCGRQLCLPYHLPHSMLSKHLCLVFQLLTSSYYCNSLCTPMGVLDSNLTPSFKLVHKICIISFPPKTMVSPVQ